MNIIQLTKNFKEIGEWQTFCSAQSKQIISLTQEITDLKEKNKQLEKMLSQTVPLVEDPNIKDSRIKSLQGLNDEESIAVMELAKLKDLSFTRPLDPAETKQYEIYTKILHLLKQTKKKPELLTAEGMSDAEILKIVDSE